MRTLQDEILCVGELLWDALPDGLFLGGAPFNVACHLHALGERVAMVSRVGNDMLGREALIRLRGRGMTSELIQIDENLETGVVRVSFDEDEEADYRIPQPVAWDALSLTGALAERASEARAIVFGSLAQRREATRHAVRGLCDNDALKVFDVNLRPPYTQRSVVESSLDVADVVKMNEQELLKISAWVELAGDFRGTVEALARRYDCQTVCVTRGAAGSALWHHGVWTECGICEVEVQDTVGAGDAFLAALLSGLLGGHDGGDALGFASRLSAFVASHTGATPLYQIDGPTAVSDLPVEPPPHAEAAD